MKRTLFSIISTGIITILMHCNANAQVALNKSLHVSNHFNTERYNAFSANASPETNIDFRTLKDFKKRFTSKDNAAWYPTDEGYIAEFFADSIKTTAAYGKKGKWFYTIQRYHEQKLPADIRTRVKSIYFDYTISVINEVHVPQGENAIYILSLQYNHDIKIIRVCGDMMDVVASYHS
jgi:hypothetical protein